MCVHKCHIYKKKNYIYLLQLHLFFKKYLFITFKEKLSHNQINWHEKSHVLLI